MTRTAINDWFPLSLLFALLIAMIGCVNPHLRALAQYGGKGPADQPHTIGYLDDTGNEEIEASMPHLKKLPVRRLDLGGKRIDDRIIPRLAELDQLEILDVGGTAVTAAAVLQLSSELPRLHGLVVTEGQYSEDELALLRARIAKVLVYPKFHF